jgi:uncharacterized membrane protein
MNLTARLFAFAFLGFVMFGATAQGAVSPEMGVNGGVGAVAGGSSSTPSPYRLAQSKASSVSFADVSPILNQRCAMCHSGPKAARDLRLDSYGDIMKGGKNGTVVVPGKPGESEIVRRIKGQRTPRMPMNGPPWLSDQETRLIEQWIAGGASEGKSAASEKEAVEESKSAGAVAPRPASNGSGKPPEPSEFVTYADVAPILNTRCTKCHAEKGMMGRPPEGIRLNSYEAIVSGSERPVLFPGSPEASRMVRAVKGLSSPRMPKDGPPYLDDKEIELITRWVGDGARDSNGQKPPVPVGASLRLEGRLTAKWQLDGLNLVVDGGTRLDKGPAVGDYVEVRGVVLNDGRIHATRIRPR